MALSARSESFFVSNPPSRSLSPERPLHTVVVFAYYNVKHPSSSAAERSPPAQRPGLLCAIHEFGRVGHFLVCD